MRLPIMLPEWEAEEYDRDTLIESQLIEALRTAVARSLKSSLPGYREGDKIYFYPEDWPETEKVKVGVSFSLPPTEDRALVELKLFKDNKVVGRTKVSVPLISPKDNLMKGLYRIFPTEPVEREMADLLSLLQQKELKEEREEDYGMEL